MCKISKYDIFATQYLNTFVIFILATQGNGGFSITGASDGNSDFVIQGATDGNSDFRIQGATDGNSQFQIHGPTDGGSQAYLQNYDPSQDQGQQPANQGRSIEYKDPSGQLLN